MPTARFTGVALSMALLAGFLPYATAHGRLAPTKQPRATMTPVAAPPPSDPLPPPAVQRVPERELTPPRPLRPGARIDVSLQVRIGRLRGGSAGSREIRPALVIPLAGLRREFAAQSEPSECSARSEGPDDFHARCNGDTQHVDVDVSVEAAVMHIRLEVQNEGGGGGVERYRLALPAGARMVPHRGHWEL